MRDDCLALVAKRIASFEYERSSGSFKGWLYRIAHGKIVDLLRRPTTLRVSTESLHAIEDRANALDERWETLWRREHLRHAFDEVRRSEDPAAVQVFELLLIDGLGVPEVCTKTGLAPAAVYRTKARVLRRVREVLRQLGVEA